MRDAGTETKVDETADVVIANESMTAEDLAQIVGVSVILAKER